MALEVKRLDELKKKREEIFEVIKKMGNVKDILVPKTLTGVEQTNKSEFGGSGGMDATNTLMGMYNNAKQNSVAENPEMFNVNAVEASVNMAKGFVDGFFDGLYLQIDKTDSSLDKAWKNMANAFISQVQRMATEWLAFMAIKSMFGLLGIPIPGAAKGGDFLGTSSGVMKMAKGGSFTVPNGFASDSYPLMVQSGERVSVTPSNRVNDQDRLIGMLTKKLDILTLNIIENGMNNKGGGVAEINLDSTIKGNDIYLTNKKNSKIARRLG